MQPLYSLTFQDEVLIFNSALAVLVTRISGHIFNIPTNATKSRVEITVKTVPKTKLIPYIGSLD